MNKRKKECTQFCEQCGDCLECYADEVCGLTKLRTLHGEMLKSKEKFYFDKERQQWLFNCPGCECLHFVNSGWTFNGDLVNPTVSPSILVRGTVPITDEEHEKIMAGEPFEPKPMVCHSFVRDGNIQFLDDCLHELKGQTVALPLWNSD